jgi:hypothetical protein
MTATYRKQREKVKENRTSATAVQVSVMEGPGEVLRQIDGKLGGGVEKQNIYRDGASKNGELKLALQVEGDTHGVDLGDKGQKLQDGFLVVCG